MLKIIPLAVILSLLLSVCACSGGKTVPTSPSLVLSSASGVHGSNRILWGMWDMVVPQDRTEIEMLPMRGAGLHLNTVRMLEAPSCQNCFTITNIHPAGPDTFQVDVNLTHPFPGLIKYTGFDVRGVFISQADYGFIPSGRTIAWGPGVPRMVNPDGYTSLFNPTEFPQTNPPALGYIPGKFSTGGDLSSTLNPFVAFKPDEPRRIFQVGTTDTRTVTIQAPAGPVHFGYAVDVSWHPVENVVDPLSDFPLTANCIEAYQISVEAGVVPVTGGSDVVVVRVMDHQGLDTIASVSIYSPQIFDGEIPLTLYPDSYQPYATWAGSIANSMGAVPGVYPLLARVVDTDSDPNLGQIDAWQVFPIEVGTVEYKGWVRTWGGPDKDSLREVSADISGNAVTSGSFEGTTDFDPGPGVDEHQAHGADDAFLSKLAPNGNFLWAKTWGGNDYDWCYGHAVDSAGYIYATGFFLYNVDFDPGPGEDYHSDEGGNTFLSKFDPDGNFLWVKTWGAESGYLTEGFGVIVDNQDNPVVWGIYGETVDFDPGPGEDFHTSNGFWDFFLSKFDSYGVFQWARTWGSPEYDFEVLFADLSSDLIGNIYVRGIFKETMDFDPGPDELYLTPVTEFDSYLSIFGADGSFNSARSWDRNMYYLANAPLFDGSGNMYLAQNFTGTWDMNPGAGVDNFTSNGEYDICISEFNALSGEYLGSKTWGGSSDDYLNHAAIDASGNVYTYGGFSGTVDFDPGPGTDLHISDISGGLFVSKFAPDDSYLWARTWGSSEGPPGYLFTVDNSGNVFISGVFIAPVDLYPGPITDYRVPVGESDAYVTRFPSDGDWW